MTHARPFPWEKSYPPKVDWAAPVRAGTVNELFERAAATYPGNYALEYRDKRTTYKELNDLVSRAAAGLISLGVKPGTPVGLYLPNTPVHPIMFFAVLKCGGRVVHMSPLDAERELAHKLKDSGARIMVTTNFPGMVTRALKLDAEGLLDHLIVGDDAEFGPAPINYDPIPANGRSITLKSLLSLASPPSQWPEVSEDDIALLQYTGGTTGLPKGAMILHRNLTSTNSIYKNWAAAQREIKSGEKVILVLPLFHIYALSSVFLRAIDQGNECMLRPRFDVETTFRDIEEKKANYFPGVPTMWIALVSSPGLEKRDLSSLSMCASGGAPLPVEIFERFKKLTGISLRGGWGMTETSPAGTNLPYDGDAPAGTIGLPLPGLYMDIVALDDPSRVLPFGETGEMRIKGPNVFAGYWNKPEETKNAFVGDGYFLTGDIGYMNEDGWLFLVDRKKDMIISGGFNVYPSVIEYALFEHPDIEGVIVIGVPDDYRGEAAKAFIKMRAGATPLTLDAVREFLADKVGKHEMPAAIEIRDALPMTSVGKLSKKELVEEERRKYQAMKQQNTPATAGANNP
ncbi:MAG: dicarboxylate--CoA ligase PimA [Xanthobacteraceae bacterium]|nr:dicarboxylate--CoA ligase PimA [Xanthobacteraceae bacterium]QYK45205.1 MAG: dicarboxylate--CoA ligase PimA [Xanthobacteraceae bacterium]